MVRNSILEAPGFDFGGFGNYFFEIFAHFGMFLQSSPSKNPSLIINSVLPKCQNAQNAKHAKNAKNAENTKSIKNAGNANHFRNANP